MNKIQGCVYFIRRTPVLPVVAKDEDKSSSDAKFRTYREDCELARKESATFCMDAERFRSTSEGLRFGAYAYRSVTDDASGVAELINDFLGNESAVLLDAEHLPNVRSLLIANAEIQSTGSRVWLYENKEFKDLFIF